jgi:hypothetical protein
MERVYWRDHLALKGLVELLVLNDLFAYSIVVFEPVLV